jgi:hypothetical protein
VVRPPRTRAGLPPGGVDTGLDALRNIAELIDSGGNISIGELSPIPCAAAVATDGHNSLAMLRRRQGEPLHELLVRLDEAIGVAWNEGCFADEINPPLPAKSIRR